MSTFKMISVSASANEVKPWKVIDVKGAKYLTRDDVYQRFKLSKNINISSIDDINKKISESTTKGMSTLPLDNISIHVNGNNMNPYLISRKSDINTIILTIEKDCMLIEYEVSCSVTIPCTFRQKGICGCLLNFYNGTEDTNSIKLVVAQRDNIYDITYQFANGSIVYTIKKREEKRSDERIIGFKAKLIKPITVNYICHKDKIDELTNKLNEFGISEYRIVTFDGTEESLNTALEEVYVNKSRAVTVYGLPYGMRINPDKMKEYRMQYVFILTKTKGIITVKSN